MDAITLSTALHLFAIGAACVAAMMFALWLLHLALRNASVVDPGWALGLALLGCLYAALGPGFILRRTLIAAMAAFWGLRLGLYLVRRIWGEPEEGRYQHMRNTWGANIELKFLIFFEAQALLDIILSIPFLAACLNPAPHLHWLEVAGVALWVVAVLGESVADAQLSAFKAVPAHKGQVCRLGLWNYSRHPNYFFEWLAWLSYPLIAIDFSGYDPLGWLALPARICMYWVLVHVSGIPPLEDHMLRSRGEKFRAYQQRTRAFFPLPTSFPPRAPAP